ncbi:glycosyltransferase family 4 protein [Caldimonas brevitalea]|uniref:Glycosyltransferase n=1 Tax=Caldimonas brevitalea TaxID=413882 RepID=A0A0G3BVR7_9BURK|nr:glycosyltransferase family 4 protein [Caldimonas brevitalea]AKJ30625.1 glycosyltransferase [Caldimonas brevitalea]
MRPMRIVQVLHSHGYGGAERHALALMRGLRGLGHEVLYAGPEDAWLTRECRQAGIDTAHLGMSGLFDLGSHLRLRRLLREWGADVVHGHLVRGAHYAGWAAWRQSAVLPLCTAHATTAAKHMRRCRHIIAVSEAVKANLMAHGHAAQDITVIHNGITAPPAGDRAAVRRALGIGDSEFAVISAGRFIRDKGQDLMVQAVRACRRPVSLYLAGAPDTAYAAEVRRLAGGDPKVHFLGYRSDVQGLLAGFDAYLSASRREAFGMSLAEAGAAGLPIVATAVGGVPEVVQDGSTGLLVPNEDVPALAAALDRLQDDPALAARLGQAAREQYLARFTVEQMVQATAALCSRLGRKAAT